MRAVTMRDDMRDQQDNVFARAASFLANRAKTSAAAPPDAKALLERLSYRPLAEPASESPDRPDHAVQANRIALLRVAANLDHVFDLASAAAPGLFLTGAQFVMDQDRFSATGAGLDPASAFEACLGETIEVLSQGAARHRSRLVTAEALPACDAGLLAELRAQSTAPDASEGFIEGYALAEDGSFSGPPVGIPASLCLRLSKYADGAAPIIPLSEGCGAGKTFPSAILSGLCERIERDALALWLIGGRPARSFSHHVLKEVGVEAHMARLRRGNAARRSWFLDLTTDLEWPVAAALSCDQDGGRLSIGVAARSSIGAALKAAFTELCAMEMNHQLEAMRRDRAGLPPVPQSDSLIEAPLLQPAGESTYQPLFSDITAEEALSSLRHCLLRHGMRPIIVDLTDRAIGVPVVKVFVNKLQPMTKRLTGARLSDAIARFGGGDPRLLALFPALHH
jgi:ribosomal protein S12 methylthiotransferase accessory factor